MQVAAASANQWMHTGAQYHLVPSHAHMQSATQMIQPQTIDTNTAALHFGTLMPQLTASIGQLQLSGHPYMTGGPAAAYAGGATSGALYATQPGTPIIQQMALPEPVDANHPNSGTSSVGPQDDLGQSNAAHHYQVYTPK